MILEVLLCTISVRYSEVVFSTLLRNRVPLVFKALWCFIAANGSWVCSPETVRWSMSLSCRIHVSDLLYSSISVRHKSLAGVLWHLLQSSSFWFPPISGLEEIQESLPMLNQDAVIKESHVSLRRTVSCLVPRHTHRWSGKGKLKSDRPSLEFCQTLRYLDVIQMQTAEPAENI